MRKYTAGNITDHVITLIPIICILTIAFNGIDLNGHRRPIGQ